MKNLTIKLPYIARTDALALAEVNDLNEIQKDKAVAMAMTRLPIISTSLSILCFASMFFPAIKKAFSRINKMIRGRQCLVLFFISGWFCSILYQFIKYTDKDEQR